MAKKDNFDDVLGNKFSLVNAKSSQLLSSWMGNAPRPSSTPQASEDSPADDADLKQSDFGHDRLGVGHAVPQDIADGTFTRRAPTTNDKLLEQLIGKKRAKAHLAAKQDAERASARQQPAWQQQQQQKNEAHKVEESDDDEESRAAVITSKRQKTQAEKKKRDAGSKDESGDEIDLKPKKRVRKGRAGPTSYLDELLASRSAKKKNKAAGAEDM